MTGDEVIVKRRFGGQGGIVTEWDISVEKRWPSTYHHSSARVPRPSGRG